MKRVLIAGATGFLGRHVARQARDMVAPTYGSYTLQQFFADQLAAMPGEP